MKKKFLFILIGLIISRLATAQSTEIRPGILLPQMTTSQRNTLSATAANGMLVFDTGTQSYWLRSSGAWTELPKTAANTNFWQQTGLAGNEIKNTNSGGFWSANPTGLDYYADNTSNPPTTPVSGAGTRLMWIPSRSAFRVGTIGGNFENFESTFWDAENIGLYSFATGVITRATGNTSTAFGYRTTASSYCSTAMGYTTRATGNYSTAMGSYTIAFGTASTAMGGNLSVSRDYATALGKFNVDNPNAIFMVGNGEAFNNVNVLTVRGDNNYVGIGTDNPIAHLQVASFGSVTTGLSSYFYPGSTTFATANPSTANLGIYANQGIVSGTYIGAAQSVTASDARIKNILNRSDNTDDLARIRQLQITNYHMKDEGTWGNKTFKKVIAQEVENIYPEAVSKQKSVIPDIYALADKVVYDTSKKELTISLSKPYDLKINDIVDLVHPEKGKVRATIAAVSGNSFTVKDWLYETDKIFVFGREVDDFRVVDYEALSMLGISAIQELAKQNEELKAKIEKQNTRLEKIEVSLAKSNQ